MAKTTAAPPPLPTPMTIPVIPRRSPPPRLSTSRPGAREVSVGCRMNLFLVSALSPPGVGALAPTLALGSKWALASEETLSPFFSSGHRFSHAATDAHCKTYCHPACPELRGERSEGSAFFTRSSRTTRKHYGGQTEFTRDLIAIPKEEAMNRTITNHPSGDARLTLPALLRVILALLLLLLGVAPTPLTYAQTQSHRVVKTYPVNRANTENLQRWVNAGHDTWCRDPKLVAAHTLEQFAPGLADSTYELASQPVVRKLSHGRIAIYTYHSLDGQTTYRVTLRRPQWLRPTAGSTNKTVWLPMRIEILTRQEAKNPAPAAEATASASLTIMGISVSMDNDVYTLGTTAAPRCLTL